MAKGTVATQVHAADCWAGDESIHKLIADMVLKSLPPNTSSPYTVVLVATLNLVLAAMPVQCVP